MKLSGIWFDLGEKEESDPYLVFKISTTKQPLFADQRFSVVHVYYKQVDDSGLIDIEIDIYTGRFVELTVIDVPTVRSDITISPHNRVDGLPIFSNHGLEDNITSKSNSTIERPLSIAKYNGKDVILIGKDMTPDFLIEFGSATFYFSNRELCGIGTE